MFQRRKPWPFARRPRDECADYKQRNHHSNRFSSGIASFSRLDVLQNAVIRYIALMFQEKHFR